MDMRKSVQCILYIFYALKLCCLGAPKTEVIRRHKKVWELLIRRKRIFSSLLFNWDTFVAFTWRKAIQRIVLYIMTDLLATEPCNFVSSYILKSVEESHVPVKPSTCCSIGGRFDSDLDVAALSWRRLNDKFETTCLQFTSIHMWSKQSLSPCLLITYLIIIYWS
jgi:hypothetical protein